MRRSSRTSVRRRPASYRQALLHELGFTELCEKLEGSPIPLPSVTVIVACRNEAAHIRQFLQSLEELDQTGLALDIVIADGRSTDGTRELLQQYAARRSQIKVIDNPGRTASIGLNLAAQQASAEFIVRMDAHTYYPPEYVSRCVNVLIATGADNVGGAARTAAVSFWQRAIAAGFHSRFATGGASFRQQEYTGFTDTVPYGCWRRETLLALGLFDETLFRNQDDDFNFRIRQAGGKIWQDSSIVSYYHPRSTLLALFRQYFQYGFWRVATLRKHGTVASARQLVPVTALAGGSFLALSLLSGRVLRNTLLLKSSGALLLVSGIFYASFSAAFTIAAAKHHGWKLIPVLPLVFATYQFSYAAGFAAGLLYGTRPSREQAGMPRLFVNASP